MNNKPPTDDCLRNLVCLFAVNFMKLRLEAMIKGPFDQVDCNELRY